MHRCLACVIVLIIIMVIVIARERRPQFTAQSYPPVPYGYWRIRRIIGKPLGDFAQIDTNCSVALAAADSRNLQYLIKIAGTITQTFSFNGDGNYPPTRLVYTGIGNPPTGTNTDRYDLTVVYGAGTLTFTKNRETSFTLIVA